MANKASHMNKAKDHLEKAALEVKEAVAEQMQHARDDVKGRIGKSRDAVKASLGEAKGLLGRSFKNLKDAVIEKGAE